MMFTFTKKISSLPKRDELEEASKVDMSADNRMDHKVPPIFTNFINKRKNSKMSEMPLYSNEMSPKMINFKMKTSQNEIKQHEKLV